MSSFWRKVCKGMFYFSFAVSEIAVIILSAYFMSMNRDMWWVGLLVLLFGGFLMVMVHAFLGAALEMMYNIAALREQYCGIYLSKKSRDYYVENYSNNRGKPWDCPKCKTINEPENHFCSSCGFQLGKLLGEIPNKVDRDSIFFSSSNISESEEESDGFWQCTHCMGINNQKDKRCLKCGQIKR